MKILLAVIVVAFVLQACGSNSTTTSSATTLVLPGRVSSTLLEEGRSVHNDTCAVCHGRAGEGGIGPALIGVTERLTVADHFKVVQRGRGQMQAFSGILSPDEVLAVVAYQRDRFAGS